MIQPGQSLDKDVRPLVSELVASSNKEINGFIQVEIEMSIKMATNEFINLFFGNGVQILEFMKC